jgi:hypothetical protein
MLNKLEIHSALSDTVADQRTARINLPETLLTLPQPTHGLREVPSNLSHPSNPSGELVTLVNNLLASRNEILLLWGRFTHLFHTRQPTYTPAFWVMLCVIAVPVILWCGLVLPFIGEIGPCDGYIIWDPDGHFRINTSRLSLDQNITNNLFQLPRNNSSNTEQSGGVSCERILTLSIVFGLLASFAIGVFCATKKKAKYLSLTDAQFITEIEELAYSNLDASTRSNIIAPRTYEEAVLSISRALKYNRLAIERIAPDLPVQTRESIPNLMSTLGFFGRNSLQAEYESLRIAREPLLLESSPLRPVNIDTVIDMNIVVDEDLQDNNHRFTKL